jgi:hypothetical protein
LGIRSPEPSCNDLAHEFCRALLPDLDAGHPALQHPPLQALGEHHVASLIRFRDFFASLIIRFRDLNYEKQELRSEKIFASLGHT